MKWRRFAPTGCLDSGRIWRTSASNWRRSCTRLDVTPYEEPLETLDRKLHKTVEVRPADRPELDRKVAKVHKTGFYWRDKVFRPEEVTIFQYGNKNEEKTNG